MAWTLGARAQREIDASPGRYDNRQLVVAGKILGIIGTCLLGVGLVVGLVLLAAVLLAGSATSGTSTSSAGLHTDGPAVAFLAGIFALLMLLGWNMSRSER